MRELSQQGPRVAAKNAHRAFEHLLWGGDGWGGLLECVEHL